MKPRFYFVITALLYFAIKVSTALSQEVIFNRISFPEGTSSGTITGITQDVQGNLWFSSNGLNKYDGYHLTHYQNDPLNLKSLVGNRVECLYTDHNGIIWVGTFSGLDRLDPSTAIFTHFNYKPKDSESLSDNTVYCILEDHEGTIWVGTRTGLNKLDQRTGKFFRYLHKEKDITTLSNDQVRVIYEDRQGTIWVGCGSPFTGESPVGEGGLNRFDRKAGKFIRYLHNPEDPQSLLDNHVRAIFEDSRGNFWVGTAANGLHIMNRATGEFQRYVFDPANPEKLSAPPVKFPPAPEEQITFITEDAKGGIWIGSLYDGLNRYDPKTKKITHYQSEGRENGFADASGWWSCRTYEGVLWIGTWEGNLYKVDPYQNNIPHHTVGGGVIALIEDSHGILWMGGSQGLFRIAGNTGNIQQFVHDSLNLRSMSNTFVQTIYEDRLGSIWLGMGSGELKRFNSQTHSFAVYRNNPKDNSTISGESIISLFEDRREQIWIGTPHGADLLNPQTGTFKHYKNNTTDSNSLSDSWVYCFAEDKTGDIWIGLNSGGGVNRFNSKTENFRHYLSGANVISILQDSYGTLWVGTDAGLFRSKDLNNFSRFIPPGSEIEINTVNKILEDDQKNLWISTNKGIIKINPLRNEINVYGKTYGVNASNLYNFAGCKSKNGMLFFGDALGYYSLSPELLTSNPNPPHVVISRLRLQNQQSNADSVNPYRSLPTQSKDIILDHGQNAFSIDFAAIHFSSPENNKHLFMLENYDNAWRQSGSELTAYYYNVPPGHYIFHVKAASSDGVWAQKSIAIIINPPWWRTWWAYCIYGLLLVAFAFSIHRYQRARVLKAERERARVKELAQAKEIEKAYHELRNTQSQLIQSEKMASLGELTAGIAHEIQNPLNFVNNFSELNSELIDELQSELKGGNTGDAFAISDNIKENEQKINHHGKRADAIVKGMLQHSRSSSGVKEPTDINAMCDEYLRLIYHGLRAKDKSFNVTIKTNFDDRIGKINIIPQDIGRVILNLLTNAFYVVNEKKLSIEGYKPTVSVSTKLLNSPSGDGGKIEINVKDNGPGIPQKVFDKMFQPFFTTKPTGQGTGLGLSLAYEVIKSHGGEIKVKTKEGEGAEFVIELPIT